MRKTGPIMPPERLRKKRRAIPHTNLKRTMKNTLITFALKKLRGYAVTWPTSLPGAFLLINALSAILMCALDPACGGDVINREWDRVIEAVVGLGLMEARSVHARSEDVG